VSQLLENQEREFTIIKSDDLHIAGYASIEMVDKQNDLITVKALGKAVKKYMTDPKYRNVMTNHSNVQVGEVVNSYRDSGGKLWKTEVDDVGFFVVIKLREDIEKAKEVARDIRKGNLRSFSIGGQALEKKKKEHEEYGQYNEISDLELHEVTICEKGINPEAKFNILKMDDKMSVEQAIEELNKLVKEVNEMPELEETPAEPVEEFFEEPVEEEISPDLESLDTETEEMEYQDSEEKSFTDLATGQVEAGEAGQIIVSGGKPTPKHDQIKVVKGFDIPSLNLTPENLERAYSEFKKEQLEKIAHDNLEKTFANRFNSEQSTVASEIAKAEYDAQAEVTELKKQFSELLDHLKDERDNVIVKQEQAIEELNLPTNDEINEMSWGELDNVVKRLVGE
jgi:HK97 family phage prohead protease